MSGPERQSSRLAARGNHQPAAAGEPTATGYLMGQRSRLGTVGQGRQVAAAFVEVPDSDDPSQIAEAIRANAAGILLRRHLCLLCDRCSGAFCSNTRHPSSG